MSEDPKYIESCRNLVKFLEAAVKNMAVYPADHPSVRGVCQRAHENLLQIFRGRDEISLGIANGVLFVDDYHFSDATPYSHNFSKILNSFEIENMEVSAGVAMEDILSFAGVLNDADHTNEGFLRRAEEVGLRNIGLSGLLVTGEDVDPAVDMLSAYRDAVRTTTGFFRVVAEGKLPALEKAVQLVGGFSKYLDTHGATLLLLTSLKGYRHYTEQHCVNVCLLAMLLADQQGLSESEVGLAALAGLMHDVGMVKVPREVAGKAGSLTLGERETFKSHPVHSAGIVHGMGGPDEVVYAVERHHVHPGGGGYPAGVTGSQVPPLAGIVCVADTFDAVTSLRPYKSTMDPVHALAFIEKGRGQRFEPEQVDALAALAGPWPPGSTVRLSSNEIGVVVRRGGEPNRPVVRMFIDENGTALADPWELDLAGDEVQGRVVAGVVDPGLYALTPEMVFA